MFNLSFIVHKFQAGHQILQRTYPYLQAMFQIFEQHCIYPLRICIAISNIISIWKLLT